MVSKAVMWHVLRVFVGHTQPTIRLMTSHFSARKHVEECAVGETARPYAASFVTTFVAIFVTMECAVSLVSDPTIFISCQS